LIALHRKLAPPIALLYLLASPVTYVLAVVQTWQSSSSFLWKILMSVTVDAILAGVWPVTWVVWIVGQQLGMTTPIETVLGF
jgi:hypothetical protein